ncbi:MAG: hypothetical protein J6B85_02395 [Lachnospiraceae bacterium]|nr:hypothetical protein [Lachnospiraceae bacterium]
MIAFLGSEKEGEFSANLAALGIAQMLEGTRVAIIENHTRGRYAGRCLIEEYIRSLEYHNAYIYKGRGTLELPCGCRMVDVWNQKLFYIAQEPYGSHWMFEHEFARFLPYLDDLERYCELLYVGVERNAESTGMILQKADIIVVNVGQRAEEIEAYLQRYQEYLPKLFFLIGGYKKEDSLNRTRICKKYGIDRMHLAVIPYDEEYYRCVQSGEAVSFMLRYGRCGSRAKHYPFVNGLRDAQKRITKMIEEVEGNLCTGGLKRQQSGRLELLQQLQ